MATAMRTGTRRRRESSDGAASERPTRREPRAGEAHYRDMLLQLQGEFARVVEALETRAASLEQHNSLLENEASSLRSEVSRVKDANTERDEQLREAQEQAKMLREESASKEALAAKNERELRVLCEKLTLQMQAQQKQWALEKDANAGELQRVNRQLQQETARLAQEQQRNAHMSQELTLLQCRVDAAVKTSRSFEARLQQLKQLKKDEKADFEAHVAHLTARLEDKKEQNRYLAEALMEKEARRAARKEKEAASASRHPREAVTSESSGQVRRREKNTTAAVVASETSAKYSSRYATKMNDYDEKKRHYGLSGLLEDLQSHAPTSPTSSASPARSPSSSRRFPEIHRTAPSRSTTPPAARVPESATKRRSTRVGSDRLQRELDGLRRKFDECMHSDNASVEPMQ